MIKLVCLSDTHTMHSKVTIPECDILVHSGDYSSVGRIAETKSFLEWFNKQPARYKLFTDGNHDGLSEEHPGMFKEILAEYPDITYLNHNGITIEGLKFWGRATTPRYGDWAHMADRGSPKMLSTLRVIPTDTDVLITHGSPKGILDQTMYGESVGCEDLLNELNDRLTCNLVVFGHLHASSGIQELNGKTYVNAAILDDYYKQVFKPKVLTYENGIWTPEKT